MNDNEALAEVRAVLNDGWVKGALHATKEGEATTAWAANRESSCILGALQLAAQDVEQSNRLDARIRKGIRRLLGRPVSFIPSFNDDEHTTKEDVLLAIKYAEEEESSTE